MLCTKPKLYYDLLNISREWLDTAVVFDHFMKQYLPLSDIISGPPESPWHESFPLSAAQM